MKAKQEQNLLKCIFEELITTHLNDEVITNLPYRKSNSKTIELSNQYYALDLKKQQRKVIDTYIDSINQTNAIYGDFAYKTGFKHCIILLKQLGVI